MSQLLNYIENTTRENAVSEELEDIQEMVDVVKEDAEVTVAYVKGFERDQMFLEEGKRQRADAAVEEIEKLRRQLEELQKQ